eukprot:15452300-Alexandrium_andersonii.AAC.1
MAVARVAHLCSSWRAACPASCVARRGCRGFLENGRRRRATSMAQNPPEEETGLGILREIRDELRRERDARLAAALWAAASPGTPTGPPESNGADDGFE